MHLLVHPRNLPTWSLGRPRARPSGQVDLVAQPGRPRGLCSVVQALGPVVVDGRVIVGSHDGHLYVIDLIAGTEQQKLKLDGAVAASPGSEGSSDSVFIAVAVFGGVHANSASGNVAPGVVFV